ncbi:MAG: anti-sigma factor domain-containing protein [Candidatus Humimicrobiaceae bacterium]
MKAVVMEIHKDYCIVMTGDGRFVREAVPAGELEIGDEIIVEEETFAAPSRDWIKTFAITAVAVLVVGFGTYGVFRIFGGSGRGGETAMVADAEMLTEEKASDETFAAAEEESVEEAAEVEEAEMAATAEESEDFAFEIPQVEEVPAGPGEVDVGFDLQISKIGEPVEIIAGNLLFLYWVAEADEDMELLLIVEMLDPDLSFTGKIEASILFDDGEPAGSEVIKFFNFSRSDKSQNFIEFLPDAYALHIRINGVFE